MLPAWASVLLGLGIPGIAFSLWSFCRRRNREILSLVDEIRLNVRLLEALLHEVEERTFKDRRGILDFAIPDRRVSFQYTRYRALLPLSHIPAGIVSDILLFYEKLERLEDYMGRLAEGEDVAASVELDPPGPMPVTRRGVASWQIRAIAKTNCERGETILVRLTRRRAVLMVSSAFRRLRIVRADGRKGT